MVIDQLSTLDLTTLLDRYYQEICTYQLDAVSQTRNALHKEISNNSIYGNVKYYFDLLEYRYALLYRNLNQANILLVDIYEPNETTDKHLRYYYYFFRGLHVMANGKYSEARPYFEKAERLLTYISDNLAIAEHHYRVAEFNYYLGGHILAIRLTLKAQELFSQKTEYINKQACCENLIALSCLTLKQYDFAEELFLSALGKLHQQPDDDLHLNIRFNIGLLYSRKNLPQVSIRHLSQLYEKRFHLYKTTFLLALEYFKIGETNNAEKLIAEGIAYCEKHQNEEYKHHLTLINLFQHKLVTKEGELQIKEGFAYFFKEELYEYIEEYAEMAALYFSNQHLFEKASHYFKIAYDAKQKQLEIGEF